VFNCKILTLEEADVSNLKTKERSLLQQDRVFFPKVVFRLDFCCEKYKIAVMGLATLCHQMGVGHRNLKTKSKINDEKVPKV
jgi:hypothetical protein